MRSIQWRFRKSSSIEHFAMNILIGTTAAHFGGTERWISMAAAELERRGHSVFVACPDHVHAPRFAMRERLFHGGPKSLWDRKGKKRLAEFCRANAIEVLLPTSHRLVFVYGRVARRLGVAVAARLGIVRLPVRPVIDWYGYGIYPNAVIVNAERIKAVLSRAPFADAKKIHVIYNGIVEPNVTRAGRDPAKFAVVSVGTMVERKGMGQLIRAIALLPEDKRGRVHATLIGAGPLLEDYRALAASLGLERQVTFTGDLANPAVHFGAADLFVLLSDKEGISNAVLEAMSAGVPVYATLAGGHGEFLRDRENAYVAWTREPKDVADDLYRIMADPLIARIGAAGRATAKEWFSLERMGDRLETLLHAIAKQH